MVVRCFPSRDILAHAALDKRDEDSVGSAPDSVSKGMATPSIPPCSDLGALDEPFEDFKVSERAPSLTSAIIWSV